jgi:hypothetical protein
MTFDKRAWFIFAVVLAVIETCWLYRVQGSEANQRGHFPLWSLCFEDNTLARKGSFPPGLADRLSAARAEAPVPSSRPGEL